MQLTKSRIARFQRKIFDWWQTHARDLPWRHTSDPYSILVSEVMLQQTQVQRVLPKYAEFLAAYPDAAALAVAKPADVLRLWKGLGYNRRALYLQRTAQIVMEKHGGKFPDNEKALRKFPGMGTYTVRAVMVFAFRKDVAMVDTNIRQIMTNEIFGGVQQPEQAIAEIAEQLVPKGKSWEWHQALMDYGSLALVRDRKHKVGGTPFEDTLRFLRGRVFDELVTGSKKEEELVASIAERYGKPLERVASAVAGMEHDGLLKRAPGGIICLPD